MLLGPDHHLEYNSEKISKQRQVFSLVSFIQSREFIMCEKINSYKNVLLPLPAVFDWLIIMADRFSHERKIGHSTPSISTVTNNL